MTITGQAPGEAGPVGWIREIVLNRRGPGPG